jgi:hypothetical protein
MQLATKTLDAINKAIEIDQGAAYRVALGRVMPTMSDAFSGDNGSFRSHLGASLIGEECARKIWYGFHWFVKPKFDGRMLRLFNRGHLEEARFIAMLLAAKVTIYQQDENGKQFRISDCDEHFGGSGDGVAIGLPDLPNNEPCLLEFKTHNDKSFKALIKSGVDIAKPQHYAQMQVYMRKMGLRYGLYGAVNKNDDSLHLEIIALDIETADLYLNKAKAIIWMRTPPRRISESPGWLACSWCDYKPQCHLKKEPDKNCRTCDQLRPIANGQWSCYHLNKTMTKEEQLIGCDDWSPIV